jgi:hypothetical protein
MNNYFLPIIIFLSFSYSLYGLIIESDDFSLIEQHAEQDTLVIFDIDNTIARYKHHFGSDEWFSYLVNQKINQGHDYLSAVYTVLPLAYYAHFNLSLILTNTILPSLIRNLIQQKIHVIGLTSRGMYLAERTHEQLTNIGIRFLIHPNNTDEFLLPLPHLCFYKYNIIFTSNNNKGETLLCFFNMINYYPKKVIFIDDKMYHVLAVDAALKNINIEYIGIRYTGCDHYIHNFNPAKAEAQWNEIKENNVITTMKY